MEMEYYPLVLNLISWESYLILIHIKDIVTVLKMKKIKK